MTTIAFNDKEFAYDSRVTADGIVLTDEDEKAVQIEGAYYIGVGIAYEIDKLISAHLGKEDIPEDFSPECLVYKVVKGEGVYQIGVHDEGIYCHLTKYGNYSCGTGEHFALAAMDLGKSPKEAVEYAKTRCIYTGGKVKVIKL